NAIVDWVQVQLRSAASTAVATQAALIQRDGDIVALDGTSALEFAQAPANYFVNVLHRNHLGVMTSAAVALSTATNTIDFTVSGTATYGSDAQSTVGAYRAMWAGDASGDKILKYSDTYNDNDRAAILTQLGVTKVTARVKNGYFREDVNMDGKVKYSGINNDRIIILKMIGGSATTTNTRTQTF
ncbi:MAG: hemagglutinin protein, partial [Saprospiraceae bacterium]|nr:hemagglutinin protein [Saprospiraceae bacterium]